MSCLDVALKKVIIHPPRLGAAQIDRYTLTNRPLNLARTSRPGMNVNTALRARSRSGLPHSTGLSLLQRQLSTKPRVDRPNVDLVGPSDPVSNIRPVKYASAETSSSRITTSASTSPYSIQEFTNVPEGDVDRIRADERIGEDLEWRLRRERVDAKNHEFWAVTNTLFQTHLDHRLETQLPPAPSSDAPADAIAAYNEAKDHVLTEFYRDWLEANKDRQARWIWEWWGDVRHEVWDGLRRTFRWR